VVATDYNRVSELTTDPSLPSI